MALKLLFSKLRIEQRVYGDHSLEVARTLNNMGVIYQLMGQLDKALEYLVYASKMCGNDAARQRDLAACFVNMASAYREKKEYEDAIKVCVIALGILKNCYGEHSQEVLKGLEHMVLLYQLSENHLKALEIQDILDSLTQEVKK